MQFDRWLKVKKLPEYVTMRKETVDLCIRSWLCSTRVGSSSYVNLWLVVNRSEIGLINLILGGIYKCPFHSLVSGVNMGLGDSTVFVKQEAREVPPSPSTDSEGYASVSQLFSLCLVYNGSCVCDLGPTIKIIDWSYSRQRSVGSRQVARSIWNSWLKVNESYDCRRMIVRLSCDGHASIARCLHDNPTIIVRSNLVSTIVVRLSQVHRAIIRKRWVNHYMCSVQHVNIAQKNTK